MEDLIKTFYIDWKLLIAQAVNFTIILLVLGIYALKPLTKLMRERQEKIEKSLTDAGEIENRVAEIEKDKQNEIKKGRIEAQALITKAEKQAEELRQERVAKAQKEVEKVIEDARSQIRAERSLMVKEVKAELGGLVGLALDKIASTAIDNKKQAALIEEALKDLSKTEIK